MICGSVTFPGGTEGTLEGLLCRYLELRPSGYEGRELSIHS